MLHCLPSFILFQDQSIASRKISVHVTSFFVFFFTVTLQDVTLWYFIGNESTELCFALWLLRHFTATFFSTLQSTYVFELDKEIVPM